MANRNVPRLSFASAVLVVATLRNSETARSSDDLTVRGHEIYLVPGVETVGVTNVAGFQWIR
jgi:hypothetical protein